MPTILSSKRPVRRNQEPTPRGNSLKLVFNEIREMIVRGKLSPGTWIIEADLADRLGYSRTPVRGALHWLQREGYVVASGNTAKSRMSVAPLTKEDARELYSIIGHIEGLGARLTAQTPQATRTKLIRKLNELNEGLAELVSSTGRLSRQAPGRGFSNSIARPNLKRNGIGAFTPAPSWTSWVLPLPSMSRSLMLSPKEMRTRLSVAFS